MSKIGRFIRRSLSMKLGLLIVLIATLIFIVSVGFMVFQSAKAVLDEVKDAVRAWPSFAAEAEVRDEFVAAIARQLA